jgi:NADH-quinone oxidoreductase subunit L
LDNKYFLDVIYLQCVCQRQPRIGHVFLESGRHGHHRQRYRQRLCQMVGAVAAQVRKMQTGFIYTYAAAMVFGVLVLLGMTFWHLFAG